MSLRSCEPPSPCDDMALKTSWAIFFASVVILVYWRTFYRVEVWERSHRNTAIRLASLGPGGLPNWATVIKSSCGDQQEQRFQVLQWVLFYIFASCYGRSTQCEAFDIQERRGHTEEISRLVCKAEVIGWWCLFRNDGYGSKIDRPLRESTVPPWVGLESSVWPRVGYMLLGRTVSSSEQSSS